eukprot:g8233.t1
MKALCEPCKHFVSSFFDGKTALPTRRAAGGAFEVPVVGVGCWSFGSMEGEYWGQRDQAATDDIVKASLEYGPAFFDTAEAYQDGRSEEALGVALASAKETVRQGKAIVASKILPNNCAPGQLREHLDATLQRLGVESIYLYQVHWPLTGDLEIGAVFGELNALQAEGKIKHIGVSNFGPRQLREALATGTTIATNQLMYNLLSRGIEFELTELCQQHDIGIICYSPLLQGLLTDKGSVDTADSYRTRTRHFSGRRDKSRHREEGAEPELKEALAAIQAIAAREGVPTHELAMAWCLALPAVVSIIPGAKDRAQLESNMAVGARPPMRDELKAELDAVTDALKAKLGPHIDYYASKDAQRSF